MQFAILVSVLVALLLSSFLLFTYTYSSFSLRTNQVLDNIDASNKGVSYMSRADVQLIDSLSLVLNEVPVLLKTSFWGAYQLVHSKGGAGSTAFEKVALLGAGTSAEATGIYLENNQLPLVLAGNTFIEGDAYTPDDIIKPGSISGHYFSGNQLIHGRRFKSAEKLPALNTEWRSYIQEMLHFIPGAEDVVVGLENIGTSFFLNRRVIFQENKIFLDQSLSGNIIVVSPQEIEVSAFAKLDQVLLIAPKVIFRSEFAGNAHVLSEEAIVEENVRLHYPSSITVLAREGEELKPEDVYKPKIIIGQKSIFEGNILFLDSSEDEGHKNDVLLAEDSFIEGNVYSEGYTELRGTVLGSIYTRYFVANQAGSLYINHIYNGRILEVSEKREIAGLVLKDSDKKVAAWLY